MANSITATSHRKIRAALMLPALGCCLIALSASTVLADLSASQARKAIARLAGFELKDSSVRVKTVSSSKGPAAEVTAEIRTVFKFVQDKDGNWRAAEIRTRQDHWEEIDLLANAMRVQIEPGKCTVLDPPGRRSASDPSAKRARCLLGSLLGVESPSDALRIQSIEPMTVPLASQTALVVAWVRVDARLLSEKAGWRVTELRTGNSNWVKLESVVAGVNEEKQKKARGDMELIAAALEKFRIDRGFYVVSDSQAVAVDHLSPRYLAQVIRVDPWHQPYKYQGERDRFMLRSDGPDGKADTPDDIQVLNSNHRP